MTASSTLDRPAAGGRARRPAPRDPSWYERTGDLAPELPAATGTIEAEIGIVGGGLAGLAVALSLAERGARPVLLEAGPIGGGASGRNGGMASSGFTRDSLQLAQALGEAHAVRLHAASRAALATIRERIRRHAIPCDPVDGVVVASLFHEAPAMAAEAERSNRLFGTGLLPCDRAWMRERYRTSAYRAGLLDPEGFHLDPLALARGYARAALALGAVLHPRSPATRLARDGDGWRVTTPTATLRARHLVLCTNAHGDALWPPLRRALVGIHTYIIVTEPLGARLGEAIAAPYAVFDDRVATGYYRPLRDGRLLWGGRVSLRPRPPDLEGLMRRDLARIYPQLAGVPVAAAWSGTMGFALGKMPLLGRLAPGLWVSTAYGGHGLNGTTMGGELVARALLEADPAIEDFAVFRPRPLLGPVGRLAAQTLYEAHALRDAWRAHRAQARG